MLIVFCGRLLYVVQQERHYIMLVYLLLDSLLFKASLQRLLINMLDTSHTTVLQP